LSDWVGQAVWLLQPIVEGIRNHVFAADCVDLQKQLWDDVPFIPMGEYWQATAYRKDLADVLPGCFATFYGVRRT
jgi:hypothetical protein